MSHSRRSFLKTSLGAAAGLAGLSGCSGAGTSSFAQPPTPAQPLVRQNINNLTAEQRNDFVAAILALKRTPSPFDPSVSYYDQFVLWHMLTVRKTRLELGYGIAHDCPAFLTWHRKLLLLYEQAIRGLGLPSFALPYWDWTDAASQDVLFSDDFMGPSKGDADDNYAVTSGPFRKGVFPVNIFASPIGDDDTMTQCPFWFLTRGPALADLPTADDVTSLMAVTAYDAAPYDVTVPWESSFRSYLGGVPVTPGPPVLHSAVHAWVGGSWTGTSWSMQYVESSTTFAGSMTALDTSPNDPVFFVHHCNVDRLWAQWEALYGNLFVPDEGANEGWNLDDTLYPFSEHADNPLMNTSGLTNASMLDLQALGYTYDDL